MGYGVWGLTFGSSFFCVGVEGLGFTVWGSLRVESLAFSAEGFEFKVEESGLRVFDDLG